MTEQKPGRGPLKHRLIFAALLTVLWLMLWGSLSPLAIVGGLCVALAAMAVFPFPAMSWEVTVRPWPAVVAVARFVFDVLAASVQVAWLAVRPAKPPLGAIIEVQLEIGRAHV